MPQGLGLNQLPGRSGFHSLDDVVVWSAFLNSHINLPEVVKSSFSEH